MTAVALSALVVGCVLGFLLTRWGRPLLVLAMLLVMIGVTCFGLMSPATAFPGDSVLFIVLAFGIAPNVAAGLIGGAIFAWLLRRSARAA